MNEMINRKQVVLLLLVTVLPLAVRNGAAQQETPGDLYAVSDGKGQISMLWFPPPSRWPAGGWKLSDSTGQPLAPHIAMADATALQPLSVEDADAVRRLPDTLAKPLTLAQRTQFYSILALRALTDPAFARALGLAWTLNGVSPGSRTYTVEGLDASGNTTGLKLTSPAVDASVATPLPPAPDGLNASSNQRGVMIFWAPPKQNEQLPAIAYTIERDGGGQTAAAVNAKPIIPGVRWDAKIPLTVDRNAPPNQMLTYRLYCVDAFGRRGDPATIRIFYPDYQALAPPQPVTAKADPGKITVSWPAAQRPNLAGYVLERAFLPDGPFEALTAQALPSSTSQYEDDGVSGGATYYYRVRAVNSRGDLGSPSSAASAQAVNVAPPPVVEGLAADAGQTRVRLTWKPVAVPVAGYLIERRIASADGTPGPWASLNARLTPQPLYDDRLGDASGVLIEYRVLAVAFDNAEGPPSATVQVAIPDRSIPDPPSIISLSGEGGKAQLGFMPAVPEARSAEFLVLRSGRADDIGVVIGDPLPASARTFTDLYVSPGTSYWYRLVAVAKNGNRSDPTPPVVIRVASPVIPKPEAATLQVVNEPFPHVVLQFSQPPASLKAIVERQNEPNGAWLRIAGPTSAATASDNNVPGSKTAAYRVSYVTSDGKIGPPSDIVTIASAAGTTPH
jgi:hypothetical protein